MARRHVLLWALIFWAVPASAQDIPTVAVEKATKSVNQMAMEEKKLPPDCTQTVQIRDRGAARPEDGPVSGPLMAADGSIRVAEVQAGKTGAQVEETRRKMQEMASANELRGAGSGIGRELGSASQEYASCAEYAAKARQGLETKQKEYQAAATQDDAALQSTKCSMALNALKGSVEQVDQDLSALQESCLNASREAAGVGGSGGSMTDAGSDINGSKPGMSGATKAMLGLGALGAIGALAGGGGGSDAPLPGKPKPSPSAPNTSCSGGMVYDASIPGCIAVVPQTAFNGPAPTGSDNNNGGDDTSTASVVNPASAGSEIVQNDALSSGNGSPRGSGANLAAPASGSGAASAGSVSGGGSVAGATAARPATAMGAVRPGQLGANGEALAGTGAGSSDVSFTQGFDTNYIANPNGARPRGSRGPASTGGARPVSLSLRDFCKKNPSHTRCRVTEDPLLK